MRVPHTCRTCAALGFCNDPGASADDGHACPRWEFRYEMFTRGDRL